jgi:hypothetical protein
LQRQHAAQLAKCLCLTYFHTQLRGIKKRKREQASASIHRSFVCMSLNPSCRFFLEGFNKFTLELHSGWCSDKISLRARRIISCKSCCCCAAFSSSAQVFNFGIIYGRNLGRFSCAFCARAKLFPRLGPAARMDDIFFTRARAPQKKHTAQGGRSLAQVSTCKKDKIYSARLYKLEAFGRDNSPLVASPPPLAKTEGQRRTAPPETHTRTR